jgi:hypothetical protein
VAVFVEDFVNARDNRILYPKGAVEIIFNTDKFHINGTSERDNKHWRALPLTPEHDATAISYDVFIEHGYVTVTDAVPENDPVLLERIQAWGKWLNTKALDALKQEHAYRNLEDAITEMATTKIWDGTALYDLHE